MADLTLREHSPLGCIAMERIKQDAKWGVQNHDDLKWLAILAEEFGEAAECVTKLCVPPIEHSMDASYKDLLEYELIQVAAVCAAWVECIRRREAVIS